MDTVLLATPLTITVISVNCQITTSFTMSMIAGFTSCLNYLSGSSSNGRDHWPWVCVMQWNLKGLLSMDCTCLMVTWKVPFSLSNPINQALAVTLAQACNSKSLLLQCKGNKR